MNGKDSGDPEHEKEYEAMRSREFLYFIPWLIVAAALVYGLVWVVRLLNAA